MKKIFIVLMAVLAGVMPLGAQCPTIVVTNSNPWTENFTTQPGECWTFTGGYSGWQYHMSAAGNNAYMEHGYSSLTYDAITPMFDISGVTTPYFKIRHHQPDYEGSGVADHIQILYRASENDTWTLLHTFSAVNNNWALDSIPLPSNLTYIQLNIRGVGMGPSADGCAFDDLSIYNENNAPSCFAPFSLNASNITASSVDLTWDSNSDGTLVLYYKASTDGDYSSVSGVTLTDGVYTLNNLDDNTDYTWYLVLECLDGSDVTSSTSYFTTSCLSINTLPYYEDFDSYPEYSIPNCWGKLNPHEGYPQIESGYAHSAKALKFKCAYNNTTPVYAVMPAFDADLSDLQLTFWTRREAQYSGTFNVGYLTDATDTSSFVSLLEMNAASIGDNSYHFFTVDFDQVEVPADTTYYIAFKYYGTNSWYWFIDEVTVQEIPGCAAPTDLSVDDIADDHVTLHWSSDEPFFAISYRVAGTESWTTVQNVSNPDSTGFVLNGLSPVTQYEWFVSTDCGGGEFSDSYVSTFTTNCPLYTVPFNENFNASNTTPNCWGKYSGLASAVFAGAQLFPYSYGWNFTNVNVFGSYHASINVYGQSLQYWLVSPAIYLGGVVNPVLTFDLALTAYNSVNPPTSSNVQADDRFMVIISTDNGATWSAANATIWGDDTATADYLYSEIAAGGQEVTISLADYADQTVMIAFYAETTVIGGDNDLHIDNVFVGEGSGCSKPNQFALTGVTATSATLSWNETGDATAWNIEYGPAGFTLDGDDAVLLPVTGTTFTVNNLTTASTYDFYVQANCGNHQSSWVGPITVTPGSFNMPVLGSDTLTTCDMIVYDNGGAMGDYSPNGNSTLVIYPAIIGNAVSVSGVYATESCCDYLQIFDGAGTEGTMLGEYKGTGIIPALVSSAGPLTLFFHSDYGVQSSGFTLNVSCTSCMPPADIVASNVTTQSAELSWASNSAANSWIVKYRPSGTMEWDSAIATNTSLAINGLLPGTHYEVNIITNCGNGDVSLPTPFSFTTVMETTTLPYYTDFSDIADQNWLLNNSTCTNYWMMGSLSDTSSALFITNNGAMPGYNMGSTSVVTAEKLFTVGDASEYTISFDVRCGGEGSWDFMKVFFAPETSEYPAAAAAADVPDYSGLAYSQYAVDFSEYLSLTGSSEYPYKLNLTQGNIIHVEVSMPNPNENADASSTAKLVFMWKNDNSTGTQPGAVIYNVSVDVNNCPKPSNLTVSNITNSTADIAWTAVGSESAWNLEYKMDNVTSWTVIPVSNNAYTLSNLSAGVAYDVRVQANCGGGDVSSYSTTSFVVPVCDLADQCAYTLSLTGEYDDSWEANTVTVEQDGVPVVVVGGSAQTVSFNLCDGVVCTILFDGYENEDECSINLTDVNGTVIYNQPFMSDFVTFSFTPNCNQVPQPVEPTVATTAATDVAQTTATLNGTIANPDNVTITAKGFEWKATVGGTYAPVNVTGDNLTYNLTGLTANTGYTYKAFVTFGSTTVYGEEVTFTTLEEVVEPCETPTDLIATDVTTNSITFSWTDHSDVYGWNIMWNWGSTLSGPIPISNKPYTLQNLQPNTTYNIRIQAICAGIGESDWSEPLTVTTLGVGIDDHLANSISLYPNPAKDVVNVQCTMNNVQVEAIEVFDVYGKVVRTGVGANNHSPLQTAQINVSGLAAGMYFVRVTTEEGVVMKSFVKK